MRAGLIDLWSAPDRVRRHVAPRSQQPAADEFVKVKRRQSAGDAGVGGGFVSRHRFGCPPHELVEISSQLLGQQGDGRCGMTSRCVRRPCHGVQGNSVAPTRVSQIASVL